MTTSASNPKVASILQDIQSSYTALNLLLSGPLVVLDPAKLYHTPTENEWSIMQNLAHIVEFLPYWADEIEKLVATPERNFGRTHQHEGRLRAISEHGQDTLAQIRTALPGSYAHLEQVLRNLKDSDLVLTAHHIKFGERSLEWFIDEFVTRHLRDHVEQIKTCLAIVG